MTYIDESKNDGEEYLSDYIEKQTNYKSVIDKNSKAK